MSERNRVLSGSCRCGAVRYQVRDEFRYALICHCSQCRRATGSASKPFAGIERQKLALVAGRWSTIRASARRRISSWDPGRPGT